MIRTAFALLFVVASSSIAHADLPAETHHTTVGKATALASCGAVEPTSCGKRLVTRGHADLAPSEVTTRIPALTATA